jgi:5-methylcytosine-specific restriction endonuclease McrA
MKLSHLTNKSLLEDTKNLVRQERSFTLTILYHLKEIDHRKLFSDLKHPSLFRYCVDELGYSESAAQRRIVAARLLNRQPEVAGKIESGALSLTNISQVIKTTKDTDLQDKMLQEVEGLSKKDCEKKIFEMTGEVLPQRESKKRVADDKMKVAIILSDETIELMEKVKALIGKDLSSDQLIRYAMEAAVEKIERVKFKQTKSRNSPPPAEVNRTVSASIKRDAYFKGRKCSNCGGHWNLQFDHRKPFALGGLSSIDNIRLLCGSCNQRARMRSGLRKPNTDSFLKGQEYRHPPP